MPPSAGWPGSKSSARNSAQVSLSGGRNSITCLLGSALADTWSHEPEPGIKPRHSDVGHGRLNPQATDQPLFWGAKQQHLLCLLICFETGWISELLSDHRKDSLRRSRRDAVLPCKLVTMSPFPSHTQAGPRCTAGRPLLGSGALQVPGQRAFRPET